LKLAAQVPASNERNGASHRFFAVEYLTGHKFRVADGFMNEPQGASERLNFSVRMHIRRYTRLTNAHSKTTRHHAAMTALFVAWYNFCRKNQALRGMTPAMAAGVSDHIWSIKELLHAAK
jgi:hypothetical protein